MRRSILFLVLFLFLASNAAANETHIVARGDTLLSIAHHYGVSLKALSQANSIHKGRALQVGQSLVIPTVEKAHGGLYTVKSGDSLNGIAQQNGVAVGALIKANKLDKKKPLRVGQKLIIPGHKTATQKEKESDSEQQSSPSEAVASNGPPGSSDGMQTLPIALGLSAYYFEPQGAGRLSLKPVIMYLHSRDGHPEEDCKRWAKVARRVGWLVCPMGPEDRGPGGRGWANDWELGRQVAMSAVDALRKKYGHRVQVFGNTLIGFSEGAFVAMNVGVREAKVFNRWLILAANSSYWGGVGVEQLEQQKDRVKRVYLITGEEDQMAGEIETVRKSLHHAGVDVRALIPKGLGHMLALEDKAAMYREALLWLNRGKV